MSAEFSEQAAGVATAVFVRYMTKLSKEYRANMIRPHHQISTTGTASRLRRYRGVVVAAAIALGASGAHAGWNDQYLDGDLNIDVGAYGTLGITASDSDVFGFRRGISAITSAYKGDIEPLIDSSFNLQLTARYKTRIEAMAQLKVREQGANDKLGDYIPIAFLTYRHSPSWSVRAGRIPIDVFMLSESHDVSYAYPWVRQITNTYGLFQLDSYEGMDVNYRKAINDGFLEWRLSAGTFKAHVSLSEREVLRAKFKDYYSTILQYDKNNWRLRASYMQGNMDHMFFISGAREAAQRFLDVLPILGEKTRSIFLQGVPFNSTSTSQTAIGASYENKRWQLQAESVFTRVQDAETVDFNSGYVSAAYRLDKWTPYAALARLQSSGRPSAKAAFSDLTDEQHRVLTPLAALISSSANQTTFITGLRWDFRYNMALKLQWNRHRIGRHGGYLWHQIPGSTKKQYVNTWSLNLDFII